MRANIDVFGPGGTVQGPLAAYIAEQGRINPSFMRPILGTDGHTYFTVYQPKPEAAFDKDARKKPENYRTYRRDELQALGIQTYGTLRRDEWKQLDQAILAAAHIRLGGIQDLLDANLTYNLTNPMGTTVLEHHTINESMEAEVSMDPAVRSRKDRPNYETVYTPIPVIHADFSISSRALEASRKLGNPLDVDMVQEATRVVMEKREEMLFGASTAISFGGGSVYTYLTHPQRNQYSLGTAWSSDTGANILADVLGMVQASIDDRHYGPWMLYVPTAYQRVLGEDYKDNYPKSVRARIMEIEGIKGVKVIDTLPANNVLLVEFLPTTVRLINGMGIQVVQWQVGSSLSPTEYKVLCIQVPQIRADQAGHCGVVHGSV